MTEHIRRLNKQQLVWRAATYPPCQQAIAQAGGVPDRVAPQFCCSVRILVQHAHAAEQAAITRHSAAPLHSASSPAVVYGSMLACCAPNAPVGGAAACCASSSLQRPYIVTQSHSPQLVRHNCTHTAYKLGHATLCVHCAASAHPMKTRLHECTITSLQQLVFIGCRCLSSCAVTLMARCVACLALRM